MLKLKNCFDSIFFISLILTAAVAIGSVHAEQAEQTIPEETTQETTVAPTVAANTEATQEPTETQPPVADATEPPTTAPQAILYDVPLDEELQIHIIRLCEEKHIDSAIVFAVIFRESSFNPSAIGDSGNSLGLMQIQPRWNQERMERLGCPDLLDPFQNVAVGIDILSEYFGTGNSVEWVLMAYNGGANYANEKTASGIVSDYAKEVIAYSTELRNELIPDE